MAKHAQNSGGSSGREKVGIFGQITRVAERPLRWQGQTRLDLLELPLADHRVDTSMRSTTGSGRRKTEPVELFDAATDAAPLVTRLGMAEAPYLTANTTARSQPVVNITLSAGVVIGKLRFECWFLNG